MGLDQSKSNPPQNQTTSSKLLQGKAFYQGECDDQGRHHGKGIMKYSDGSIFEGIFNHGMPQKGTFKYPNGNVYEGELKDNKPHGKGIWKQQKGIFEGMFENGNFRDGQVKYSDGNYYKGQMENMKKCGQNCYYRFADGDVFVGAFQNDSFCYGQYTSKDKDMIYKGFFNNQSQKHGKGSLLLAGVANYQGHFKNDQFDGQGTLSNLKTSVKYEGQFKRGKKNGKGKLFGPDNNPIYEGQFVDNQKCGRGIFYFQKKRYEGSFVDGKFQGQGVLHYGDGDVYRGGFKNNKKHGKGELMLANNTIQTYKGDFVEDRFEGEGQVNYSNGDTYKGGFRGNKKHGKGVYTAIVDGKHKMIFEGEWVDDVKNGYFVETSTESDTVMKGQYKNGEKEGLFQVYESKRAIPAEEEWRGGKKIYKN